MYNFIYVPASLTKPVRIELENLINDVQMLLKPYFTFRFDIVGSAKRNMITCDVSSNIGFDFDYNIEINDFNNQYQPEQIKKHLMNAFRFAMVKYGYSKCEDSTRVITIKKIDYANSRIEHSCDFAIVHDYLDNEGNEWQEYIHFNKKSGTYAWQDQPNGYFLEDKVKEIKKNGLWNQVRDMYLDLKRYNSVNKKSRSLFAEAVNNIYNEYLNE